MAQGVESSLDEGLACQYRPYLRSTAISLNRQQRTPTHLTARSRRWNADPEMRFRTIYLIAIGTVLLLLGSYEIQAEGPTAVPPAQFDPLDCPLLPSCPGESLVPLPPLPDSQPQPEGKGTPSPVRNVNFREGMGKYWGMLFIPGGQFDMGSLEQEGRPDERPLQKIVVKDFYVSKHQATAREFCEFLNQVGETAKDGSPRVKLTCPDCPVVKKDKHFEPKDGHADHPMVCVSWHAAAEFAQWAGGRLPTSAEWEKAAVMTCATPPQDSLVMLSREGSIPVSLAQPGIQGMKGMGNVWEWCSDWYARDYYAQSPGPNPTGPSLGRDKVIRGGSWASPECSKRIQNRHKAVPRGCYRTVGFRIVKDVESPAK